MENNTFTIHHKDGNTYKYVWKYESIDDNNLELIIYESDGIPTFYYCSNVGGLVIIKHNNDVLDSHTLFGQKVYSIASKLLNQEYY